MSDSQDGGLRDLLRAEHELLGAVFDDLGLVDRYDETDVELDALLAGCALTDLSGSPALLLAGGPAPDFAHAALAGRALAVGECAHEAVLSGDGSLVGAPLVARTGDAEYVLWDLSPRAEAAFSWLRFIAGIEQGGVRPFAGLKASDASDQLATLLLAGPAASAVLKDYLHGGDELPKRGQAASLMLDRMGCLVLGLPWGDSAWLVCVGARYARVLWRSLLSFNVTTPVGRAALSIWTRRELGWYDWLDGEDRVVRSADELRKVGLVRAGSDFVGARGLA